MDDLLKIIDDLYGIKITEKRKPENILTKLEKISYVCGDLICIPKKEFYELVREYENERISNKRKNQR